jgi:hypothetical protein
MRRNRSEIHCDRRFADAALLIEDHSFHADSMWMRCVGCLDFNRVRQAPDVLPPREISRLNYEDHVT